MCCSSQAFARISLSVSSSSLFTCGPAGPAPHGPDEILHKSNVANESGIPGIIGTSGGLARFLARFAEGSIFARTVNGGDRI
mmetsp:Transcript_99014/g.166784  ORF Transcript_99014/g.166784 Transcript_99014/m.166784 type:complete len:82 (-) Transcript_99014:284-529(-)